mmetsp:Transcript_17510/g.16729  ORF Transcript_17510/g.16729 Transcript_17510/m.16729 type:complete len:206 (-) Transcript_17510:250-867(-)
MRLLLGELEVVVDFALAELQRGFGLGVEFVVHVAVEASVLVDEVLHGLLHGGVLPILHILFLVEGLHSVLVGAAVVGGDLTVLPVGAVVGVVVVVDAHPTVRHLQPKRLLGQLLPMNHIVPLPRKRHYVRKGHVLVDVLILHELAALMLLLRTLIVVLDGRRQRLTLPRKLRIYLIVLIDASGGLGEERRKQVGVRLLLRNLLTI